MINKLTKMRKKGSPTRGTRSLKMASRIDWERVNDRTAEDYNSIGAAYSLALYRLS